MSDYIRGLDREQQLLFPYRLAGYVSEDAYVRAIDAYVDSLGMPFLARGYATAWCFCLDSWRLSVQRWLMSGLQKQVPLVLISSIRIMRWQSN